MWVRVPPPAPKIQRPMGALYFLKDSNPRGRNVPAARFNRGGLRRSAGRVPPPAPKKDSVPRGAVFCMNGLEPEGARNVPAARFNQRWPAPQRRSSPTTGTKNAAPHGDAAFFFRAAAVRSCRSRSKRRCRGDRPKSGSCILRVDRGRNGDAACCRGQRRRLRRYSCSFRSRATRCRLALRL